MSNFYFDAPLDKVELVSTQNLKVNIPESIAHKDVLYTIPRTTSTQLERLQEFAGDTSSNVSVRFKMPNSTSTELTISSIGLYSTDAKTRFAELGVNIEKDQNRHEGELTVQQTEALLGALPAVARKR